MVTKTVRFALLLYDEFTGKCITQGGHLFEMDGHKAAPIHKPDGFYVFIEPADPVAELKISGGGYFPEQLRIEIGQLNPAFPVVRVRLRRTRSSGTADCEYIEGVCRPGAVVYALKQGAGGNKILAMKKSETGMRVAFSGFFPTPVTETRFMVGTGDKREIFITGDYLPDKTYLVREGMTRMHRSGEPVVRAYAARCDESGAFVMAVDKGQQEKIEEILFYDEEGKKWDCLSVQGHS